MATPDTPGKDVVFDKPNIPKPAWNDETDISGSVGGYEAAVLSETEYAAITPAADTLYFVYEEG